MAKKPFQFGTVRVKNGAAGPWRISTFELTQNDVMMMNLRAIRDGNPEQVCPPGTYTKLSHEKHGCIMSNTPMEIRTAREAIEGARGKVLVTGLGLGMVLDGMLAKPEVESIRVVEVDKDLLRLVSPAFEEERVEFIHADARTWNPLKGERFDYAWHDIWNDINDDNLPDMAKITRRYSRFAAAQGVWSRNLARRMRRREYA